MKNIRALRLLQNKKMWEVANDLGITVQHLSGIELGDRHASFELQKKIEDYFLYPYRFLVEDFNIDGINIEKQNYL